MSEEKIRKLPSGSYHAQVRDPLNPARRISITEKTEREVIARVEHYRRLRADLTHGVVTRGQLVAQRAARSGLPVKEVWDAYVRRFDEARQRAMKGLWAAHWAAWGSLMLEELTEQKWEEWERWEGTRPFVRGGKRLRGLGVKTIKTLFAQMRAATYMRVKAKEIAALPWGDWQPTGHYGRHREEREALRSIEEVTALLRAARDHDERVRMRGRYSDLYARVAVIVFAGLRQGEAGGLGWDDIEELSSSEGRIVTLRVRHQVRAHWREDHPEWDRPRYPPKKGSVGTLRLHQVAACALDDQRGYLRALGWYRPTGPVFPGAGGEWRVDETVIKPERMRDLAAVAGVSVDLARFTTHGLRHTFATLEVLASQDLVATAKRTRHKQVSTLLQYMHAGGRGLPKSPLGPIAIEPPAAPHLLPAPAPVLLVTAEHGGEEQEQWDDAAALRQILDPERTGKVIEPGDISELEAAHRRWVEGGRRTVRPPEVTEGAERARSRVYVATLRAEQAKGASKDAAQKAAQAKGHRAKCSYLGAWGKIARRLGEPAAPLVKVEPREDIRTPFDEDEAPRRAAGGGGVVLPFVRRRRL